MTLPEETNNSVEAKEAALARAITEGLSSGCASKQDVLDVLKEGPPATMIEEHTRMGPSQGRGG